MAQSLNKLSFSPRFKLDLKKAARHPEYADEDLETLLQDLIEHATLPSYYREHSLEKREVNWAGFTECHLTGDIVVIYKRYEGLVRLHRIGSHASVF